MGDLSDDKTAERRGKGDRIKMAKKEGKQFQKESPERFRERLNIAVPCESDVEYGCVSDDDVEVIRSIFNILSEQEYPIIWADYILKLCQRALTHCAHVGRD